MYLKAKLKTVKLFLQLVGAYAAAAAISTKKVRGINKFWRRERDWAASFRKKRCGLRMRIFIGLA
jgi:hypothetical protein